MKIYNKLILISLAQLCLIMSANGQDSGPLNIGYFDPGNFTATTLDFSRAYMGGSARMQGLGGAQTALGGDISSASSNPAGLGFFNRSEFSFSPTINFLNSFSDYLGNNSTDSRVNFNFANLGVVFNKTKGDLAEGKWRGGSFGVSLNRIADFHRQVSYSGLSYNDFMRDNNGNIVVDENDNPILELDANSPRDIIEYAVLNSSADAAGNLSFNSDLAELAYEAYLIDAFEIDDVMQPDRDIYAVDENGNLLNDDYIPAYPELGLETEQMETIKSTGGIYQTSLSYGGNYNDRFYFGAGLGILSVSRDIERTYTERPTQTTLRELNLTDKYSTNGVGVNATLGLIVRPINTVLLGAQYTSPSLYSLQQTQETTLSASYLRSTDYRSNYEEYGFVYDAFNYNMVTPSKLSGGITYFFGKSGFITGDVERVNYSGGKVSQGDSYDFSVDNEEINKFEKVLNFRVGAEFRLDIFRFRGGYSYFGDPVDNNIDESMSRVSAGAGVRTKDYFIDLGVATNLGFENTVSPYPGAGTAVVNNKNTAATFSVGFFF
ncbi:OmpP1/FadL family transporter [Fulvivirga ligni]|uniref:OmpP1/FadL family transporter n=1 Tax=Fulvivirga ligni TaxID=2904246 RepID=UPI001F2CA2B9|nr:hypothetical protein [Fulvivirga ligni]UII21758.1 hypothetical protein LVD16_00715 [Fulvivirga ligni]